MNESQTVSSTDYPESIGGLPIALDNLIHARSVEDNRREFKAAWNKSTRDSVVRTVCAFANDLLNLNGGYVVIGIETDDLGQPVLPPRGLEDSDLDRIQREIRGQCNRINPSYRPLLFPVLYQNRSLLVVWAPGGDTRPYEAPSRSGGREYFVRNGSETVEATGALRTQLFEQAARVPFDDRRSLFADMEEISERLVREYLSDVGSTLVRGVSFNPDDVYSKMRLSVPLNDHRAPRNFALLFFSDDPDEILPGARIEVVQFADDAGGSIIEERIIRGPIHHQVRQTLNYLDSLGDVLYQKVPGRAEIDKTVNYPYEAVREAVVNAVYHKSYEISEPTKIYMYPDRMEVISYPGPVRGIELHHFASEGSVPQVPARNRKIGEFLKELGLAETRGTGLPTIRRRMNENGSPEPRFDFDEGRTYFTAILPTHPRYRALHAIRESALAWATGNRNGAIDILNKAAEDQPGSGAIAGQIIEYAAHIDRFDLVEDTLDRFETDPNKTEVSQPYLRYATAMVNKGEYQTARRILNLVPPASDYSDLVEAAILSKRARDYTEAHRIFQDVYHQVSDDPRVVQEFAQTKIALARPLRPRNPTKRTLNRQAAELLRRAIHLTDDPVRKAWCWFDLARVLNWLREPNTETESAYLQAISLQPDVRRFRDGYEQWKARQHR